MYIKCMAKTKLNASDREFFGLVSRAAFTNPFSDQRLEIDRAISQSEPGATWVEVRPDAIIEVCRRITELDGGKVACMDDFHAADRQIIEHLFLFDVFHQFNIDFDKLIDEQTSAGEKLLKVTFAGKAIAKLRARGFSADRSLHYFSLFYQIRRAFYYIERGLVGRCTSMKKLRTDLWNNIFTHDILHYESLLWDKMEDFSTLLLGPTGCGKGAAAAAIGRSGFIPFDESKQTFVESFTEMFVPINLSQYAESLLESELFGHKKGAFTGAVDSHEGLFALCGQHGSIFLDEIGEVSIQIQIKLLQVLQERIFSPVGSHKKLSFHGRVIAATNRSIDQLRIDGKFRDDFYYRLCSDCIFVPGLQQRVREDAGELDDMIEATIKRITGFESKELARTVKEVISKRLGKDYHWPGNVRELAQCVRRVIIKRDYEGDTLCRQSGSSQFVRDIESGNLDGQSLLAGYCGTLYKKCGTYEEVARITKLDRRTVKKYIQHEA